MHLFRVLSSVVAQSTLSVLELRIWPFDLDVTVAGGEPAAGGALPEAALLRSGLLIDEEEPFVASEGLRCGTAGGGAMEVEEPATGAGEGEGLLGVTGPANTVCQTRLCA